MKILENLASNSKQTAVTAFRNPQEHTAKILVLTTSSNLDQHFTITTIDRYMVTSEWLLHSIENLDILGTVSFQWVPLGITRWTQVCCKKTRQTL